MYKTLLLALLAALSLASQDAFASPLEGGRVMLMARRNMMVGGAKGPTARDYTGAMFLVDAVENAGYGDSRTGINTITDLASGKSAFRSNVVYGDKRFWFNSRYFAGIAESGAFKNLDSWTFEICCKNISTTTATSLINSFGRTFNISFRSGSSYAYVDSAAQSLGSIGGLNFDGTITIRYDGEKIDYFVKGGKKATRTMSVQKHDAGLNVDSLGSENQAIRRILTADHALTDAEIAANWEIDKVRFELE